MDLVVDGLEILSPAECWELAKTERVGRVGVCMGALPAIFPVNYAVDDDAVVFSTGPGTKLRAAATNAVIAFEIDHADSATETGWSVLMVGRCEETDHATTSGVVEVPRPWADGDRDHLLRLSCEFMSGRRIAERSEDGR
jgi:nitroimidazol reductase NimA-like FMN-containing flavoprotein (pyridoxamine 5'-phosphate oxidase superfamily)